MLEEGQQKNVAEIDSGAATMASEKPDELVAKEEIAGSSLSVPVESITDSTPQGQISSSDPATITPQQDDAAPPTELTEPAKADEEEEEAIVSLPVEEEEIDKGDDRDFQPCETVIDPKCDDSSVMFSVLPTDSLHCIASFLDAIEWARFGEASKTSSSVCLDVIRRVRMHGFRCASEVVTAWVSRWHAGLLRACKNASSSVIYLSSSPQKLGQHADGRELTALYIQSGVPIYPHSLGHSFHTLAWRMGIEAKEMQEAQAREQENREETEGTDNADEPSKPETLDRFYVEKYVNRSHEGEDTRNFSYVEEKCAFWLNQDENSAFGRGRLSMTSRGNIMPPSSLTTGQDAARMRLPDFRLANTPDAGAVGPTLPVDTPTTSGKKVLVKVHRHLADQHTHGKPHVDDENGAMQTPPVSLSVDFYHPREPPVVNAAMDVPSNEGELLPDLLLGTSGTVQHTAYGEEVLESEVRYAAPNGLDASFVAPDGFAQADELGISLLQPSSPFPRPGSLYGMEKEPSILNDIDLEIYNAESANHTFGLKGADSASEMKRHLSNRFSAYHKKLEACLGRRDSSGFEECLLDFWDEFLPMTANIHFFDRYTAVPRVSGLNKFLSKPCPKAIGIVQCEIERIKTTSKKKGVNVKGRFFPTYEYRLFIRDRRPSSTPESVGGNENQPRRRDTVLMMAKNRGRKHQDLSGVLLQHGSTKKGANNYYLHMPLQADVDSHQNAVNGGEPVTGSANGASTENPRFIEDRPPVLLGRLQSNFIGTEFQIFTPTLQKRVQRKSAVRPANAVSSDSESDVDYDSGVSSDNPSASTAVRRNRFRRRRSLSRPLRRSRDLSGEHPQPIEEESSRSPSPDKRRMRRSYSLPVLSYRRSSRSSRRAVAHSGETPESQEQHSMMCEEEDGAITYTANLLGNRPRIMDVCVPRVSSDGLGVTEWKRYLEHADDANEGTNKMLSHFKQLQQRLDSPNENNHDDAVGSEDDGYTPPDDFGLLALQNRPPWWNIELGAFVLNFGGRVSVASVKNFQLCDRNDQDYIMLQFGRIQGRHSFTMDFQHPLTAVQAFAIAISSLQSRIAFG